MLCEEEKKGCVPSSKRTSEIYLLPGHMIPTEDFQVHFLFPPPPTLLPLQACHPGVKAYVATHNLIQRFPSGFLTGDGTNNKKAPHRPTYVDGNTTDQPPRRVCVVRSTPTVGS